VTICDKLYVVNNEVSSFFWWVAGVHFQGGNLHSPAISSVPSIL